MDNEANPVEVDEATLAQVLEPTPATEAEPASTDANESDDLEKLALGADEPANLTEVEIEIDGRKYKVLAGDDQPLDPDLKFGALRDADYRKKTMALSEERKTFQQEREALQSRANLQGEAAMRSQSLMALDAQVRALESIPVDNLRAQGYTDEQIRQAAAELEEMRQQREQLSRQVNADVESFTQAQKQEFEKLRADAVREASLSDKSLTPERCQQLEDFAVELGIDESEARMITDPAAYKILHFADIGRKFVERQRSAANMKAAATGAPAATLGGVNAGGKSPDAMGPAEMAKHLGYG